MANETQPNILCVDDDRAIAEIVQAALVDEGYAVSCLYTLDDDALLRTAGRLESDCILLDSDSSLDYGHSWDIAAILGELFTAHLLDIKEAQEGTSPRAVAAKFAAIVPKPFDLDELLVATAQPSVPGRPSIGR